MSAEKIRWPRPPHPSGRPRRSPEKRGWGDGFRAPAEPRTIGLRERETKDAIGFVTAFEDGDDE